MTTAGSCGTRLDRMRRRSSKPERRRPTNRWSRRPPRATKPLWRASSAISGSTSPSNVRPSKFQSRRQNVRIKRPAVKVISCTRAALPSKPPGRVRAWARTASEPTKAASTATSPRTHDCSSPIPYGPSSTAGRARNGHDELHQVVQGVPRMPIQAINKAVALLTACGRGAARYRGKRAGRPWRDRGFRNGASRSGLCPGS